LSHEERKSKKALRDLLPVENITTVPRVGTEIHEERTGQTQRDGVGDGMNPGQVVGGTHTHTDSFSAHLLKLRYTYYGKPNLEPLSWQYSRTAVNNSVKIAIVITWYGLKGF
jgi:hypothetical protein